MADGTSDAHCRRVRAFHLVAPVGGISSRILLHIYIRQVLLLLMLDSGAFLQGILLCVPGGHIFQGITRALFLEHTTPLRLKERLRRQVDLPIFESLDIETPL